MRQHDPDCRTNHDAQGLPASAAVLHPVHVRVLPRPGQCRLRRTYDEQGSWVQRLPFWAGPGAFYGGYCLFEVPSNLMLEKVGARFWLARIMITWGLFFRGDGVCQWSDQ